MLRVFCNYDEDERQSDQSAVVLTMQAASSPRQHHDASHSLRQPAEAYRTAEARAAILPDE